MAIGGVELVYVSPAQLLMSKRSRTLLTIPRELLKPTIKTDVKDKLYYDYNSIDSVPDDNVLVQKMKIWGPSQIIKKYKMPSLYLIVDERKQMLKRHSVHLKSSLNAPVFGDVGLQENDKSDLKN